MPRDYTPGIANLDDLEAAIMAGDWEALGATASSLAGGTDDESQRSVVSSQAASMAGESNDGYSLQSKAWQDVIDATKAAELDELISSGNWAALIQTAERYGEEAKQQQAKRETAAVDHNRCKTVETQETDTDNTPSQEGISRYAAF